MAAKRLQRLDISDELKERLARQGLTTCADVLAKSPLELMKLSGRSGLTVHDLVHRCCLSQAVKPVTALHLLKSRERGGTFFATSLPDLDKVLHGGIPTATMTEIAGPAGCGKTQFSMTLSVLATLPVEDGGLGGGVVYIDTEGAFSAKRLLEIAQTRLPQQFQDDSSLKELASQVHIVSVQSCKNLMNRLQSIEEDLIQKKIKLMVLDSVASLVRKEYSNVQGGMMRRTDFLASEAALLKYIAETFSIPVIVTNQITTRYGQRAPVSSPHTPDDGDGSVEVDGEGSYLTAALGNTWSHSVNTRLILQYLAGDRRQILVAKSPVAPFTCFDFIITKKGVEQDVQGQGHYKGTDPGKQAIQGRAGLSVGSTQW
ncbi:DNA repair protein RAD51 homolog 2-like isoform X2 [Littorina saxatilis]|uniref:RecA family profile 1 domain-containing protein n=1 Tax=Littorina saxatilis TaxID=31220 RepID=A0AAN9BH42_9CAEN